MRFNGSRPGKVRIVIISVAALFALTLVLGIAVSSGGTAERVATAEGGATQEVLAPVLHSRHDESTWQMIFAVAGVFVALLMNTLAKKSDQRKQRASSPDTEEKPRAIDRWMQARRHQDDAEHIHSAGVDTCEARLENARHLYDAGLLDAEEYRQRVARIRSSHND